MRRAGDGGRDCVAIQSVTVTGIGRVRVSDSLSKRALCAVCRCVLNPLAPGSSPGWPTRNGVSLLICHFCLWLVACTDLRTSLRPKSGTSKDAAEPHQADRASPQTQLDRTRDTSERHWAYVVRFLGPRHPRLLASASQVWHTLVHAALVPVAWCSLGGRRPGLLVTPVMSNRAS